MDNAGCTKEPPVSHGHVEIGFLSLRPMSRWGVADGLAVSNTAEWLVLPSDRGTHSRHRD